jgi:hypothetical protein
LRPKLNNHILLINLPFGQNEMIQVEQLKLDSELSPIEIIDTLRARAAIELSAPNTAEFYRYADENNFAALTFALIEGLIEQQVLPGPTLLEMVQRRPVVFSSVYRQPGDESEFLFETELYRLAPIDKQRSVPVGQPVLGDPSQIRINKWANRNHVYSLTVPVNADFSLDRSRKTIYKRVFGQRHEPFEIEFDGEEMATGYVMKSTADGLRQAMADLADVATSRLAESEDAEFADQSELPVRAIGLMTSQFVETQPVKAVGES